MKKKTLKLITKLLLVILSAAGLFLAIEPGMFIHGSVILLLSSSIFVILEFIENKYVVSFDKGVVLAVGMLYENGTVHFVIPFCIIGIEKRHYPKKI